MAIGLNVLSEVPETLSGLRENVEIFIKEKPIAATAIGAGVVGATALGAIALVSGRKRATRVRKKRTKKGRSRDRKFISKQKHEQAYIRRKRRAGKKITRPRYKTKTMRKGGRNRFVGKIHYTSKGQPYRILANGRARFIKKTQGRTR
jgi:hypothetical protein